MSGSTRVASLILSGGVLLALGSLSPDQARAQGAICIQGGAAEPRSVVANDIRTLLARSQIVAVGTVRIQSVEGARIVVKVQPERLLLGPPEAARGFTAVWTAENADIERSPSAYGLVFVSEVSGGRHIAAREDGAGFLRDTLVRLPEGPLPGDWQYPDSAVMVDKVAAELWQGALAPDHQLSGQALDALTPLLTAYCLNTPGEPDCAHFLGATEEHKRSCPYFRMMESWQETLVARVHEFLDSHSPEQLPVGQLLLLSQLRSPSVVADLGRLLARAPAGSVLEREVASGLGRIHTRDTLPFFAAMLDHPLRHMQYAGMSGFCKSANNIMIGLVYGRRLNGGASTAQTRSHCPAMDKFLEDPDRYINFWKAWYPDHDPTVTTLAGGGASCHPLGPAAPCTLPLAASASDRDGDPVYYRWSGCSASIKATADCKVNKIGPVVAVTVDDGRGGTAAASTTVTGVNQRPTIHCKRWHPGGRLPAGSEAALEFTVVDDDTTASADCRVARVYRNRTQTAFRCDGKSGLVSVQVGASGEGSKLCSVDLVWKDRWGAQAAVTCSIETE